jgi:hypothetical protein
MKRAVLGMIAAALMSAPARAVQRCSTSDLNGAYGMQLTGRTTISGTSAPAALLARLIFDGDGGVSGYSSVNFNGLLLGNPVTGNYQVSSDCTLSLGLRDDSGAWQHFSGELRGGQAELHQTDPDTGVRGPMRKAPVSCNTRDFRPAYDFTLSGTATALATGGQPESVSEEGRMAATGAGDLEFTGRTLSGNGAFDVQSDCIVTFELDPSTANPMKFRGILVNGGEEILAIQTDPGESVAARLHAR